MTYHVDSVYGNDENDGLLRQTAFRSVRVTGKSKTGKVFENEKINVQSGGPRG